jgi:hypothetical protein
VLEGALASGNYEAKQVARAVVNLLAAALEFRTLLAG